MSAGVEELEDAARNIIQIIKQIPELVGTKLKVAGGLALWHYLDQQPSPVDRIDFIADLPVTLELFQVKLLEHSLSPFEKDRQGLFYCSPAGRRIMIRFSSRRFRVELPFIHDIGYGVVPYISQQELDRLYPHDGQPGPSDVKKRQRDDKEAPVLKSRHTVGTRPRQLTDVDTAKQSAVLPSPQGVIAEDMTGDRNSMRHRRARSDPGICSSSSSVTMTKE